MGNKCCVIKNDSHVHDTPNGQKRMQKNNRRSAETNSTVLKRCTEGSASDTSFTSTIGFGKGCDPSHNTSASFDRSPGSPSKSFRNRRKKNSEGVCLM